MIGFLVRSRERMEIRIRVRVRVIWLRFWLRLAFIIGAVVAGANVVQDMLLREEDKTFLKALVNIVVDRLKKN